MPDDLGREPVEVVEEEEGGPIKSFLEHLEDLRWVLIKSLIAAGVAMIACFFGANHLFKVLKWPLDHAGGGFSGVQVIRIMLGTNQLHVHRIAGTNDAWAAVAGTNLVVRMDVVPLIPSTNQGTVSQPMLGLKVQPEDEKVLENKTLIDLRSLGPVGPFVVATKMALYGGLVIASPFIFYFVGNFVFPALRMREKKYVYRGLFFGVGLFLTGISFCYFILMPLALRVSVEYAEWFGFKADQWRVEEYISFVCKFMLGMGLGFETPVLILTLVKLGVLNYRMLAGARRYVIVISFILGAILTTPEVITQVLMAIPLMILYEISVWIAWYWERRERKQAEAEGSA
jgi:sec-independent protein translocase protein TatC